MQTIVITGGAGFIGSNFVLHILAKHPEYRVLNLDKLTYAGNLDNLQAIADNPRHTFVRGDIANPELVDHLMKGVDLVVNFAAESHVDRSIMGAQEFMQANALGAYTLLDAARRHQIKRFLQVSTDEVYGSLAPGEAPWTEVSPLAPRNPYSVSKTAGDLMARSFFVTYGMPVLITRASNNIGPCQYPEKRVPLFVTNAIDNLPLPVYGKGTAVRDHLFVSDHCEALDLVLHQGQPGEVYNVGADNDADGEELTKQILDLLGKPHSLIEYVKDRPGHDLRYALDCSKLRALGWQPRCDLKTALAQTVDWYRANEPWWRKIKESWEFRAYYEKQYKKR
ncbi:MAG: dTDP-glucose 4,6-dehydratase [Candidatus Handelsmanbacteria bacterium]|nr:dTDP-glucose 4,6-dehydratase [Candidatus Handelsmanbacteria bacterium]